MDILFTILYVAGGLIALIAIIACIAYIGLKGVIATAIFAIILYYAGNLIAGRFFDMSQGPASDVGFIVAAIGVVLVVIISIIARIAEGGSSSYRRRRSRTGDSIVRGMIDSNPRMKRDYNNMVNSTKEQMKKVDPRKYL